jgi:hypothetical protein
MTIKKSRHHPIRPVATGALLLLFLVGAAQARGYNGPHNPTDRDHRGQTQTLPPGATSTSGANTIVRDHRGTGSGTSVPKSGQPK